MSADPVIRMAEPRDEDRWRELWRGYLDFYHQPQDEAVTAGTWSRICEPGSGILCRVIEAEGQLVGFAIAVLHPGTWTLAPVCYLEDLFVDPAARGRGFGRALIDDLLTLARERGWSRLYWHTQAGNATARRLYDTYVPADDFVRYRLVL